MRMKKVQVHFDWEAKRYDILAKHFPGYHALIKHLSSKIDLKNTKIILDIGVGTGNLPTFLRKDDVDVRIIGIDISKKMIIIAKRNDRYLDLILADARYIPIASEVSDCIVSSYTLHHLTEKEKFSFIEKCFKILKPGGKILIGDYTDDTKREKDRKRTFRTLLGSVVRNLVLLLEGDILSDEHPIDTKLIVKMLKNAGYRSVSVEPVSHTDVIIAGKKSRCRVGV